MKQVFPCTSTIRIARVAEASVARISVSDMREQDPDVASLIRATLARPQVLGLSSI
ncbi:hypothetical protein BRAS3843_750006 [Bradyrhizobium sp. STM 3843]|nr:hypothetical protein BRAS3843_750006 [Bradyrhizobium sp. STM 3843]